MGSYGAVRRQAALTAGRDLHISGIESITDIGGGEIRVEFYVNRPGEDGRLQRIVLEDGIVMPISSVPDGIGKALMAIGRRIIAREDGISVTH